MLREKKELYWARPTKKIVEVWRKPIMNVDKLSERARDRNRQTQINYEDLPVKVLQDRGEMLFVQLADLTRGFVSQEDLCKIFRKKYWSKVKRFSGKLVQTKITEKDFLSKLKKFPKARYVWGGRSEKGMDCSACVQRIFLETAGYLLPRNSRDQSKKGRPVNRLQIGDIALLRGKKDRVYHIGIVSDDCGGILFHLSRLKKKPVFEEISEIEKRYRIVDIRRLIKFND